MLAYSMATEDYPDDAIYRAMRAFIQGKVKRPNHTFAPSSAEFAAECQYQLLVIERDNRPALPKPEPEPEMSPEHREKMLGLVKTLTKAMSGHTRAQIDLEPYGWEP